MAVASFGQYRDLGVALEDRVALVEIRRPPHNFFDHALIGALADAFEALDREADCRAIVLASQGKSFCAGADFASGGDFSEREAAPADGRGAAEPPRADSLYREAVRHAYEIRNRFSFADLACDAGLLDDLAAAEA